MHTESQVGVGLQCRSCGKILVCVTVTMQWSARVVHGLLSSTGIVRSLTVLLPLPTKELRLIKNNPKINLQ